MIPLRTSHIAFYAAVVTLTVSVATGIGFWFIRAEMLEGNDFLLDAEAEEIVARMLPLKPPLDAAKLEAALKEHTQNDEAMFFFQVHSAAGNIIYNSPNMGGGRLPIREGADDKETLNLPAFGLIRVAEYHTPSAHIQIAMSLRNFESVNEAFLRVFLLGIPLIACLSVAFGLVLRHLTLRPLRMMQATARQITASNLSERIPLPRGDGDMRDLARLLNEMMDRLEKSFAQIKRFTADTSHELMTPISVVRLHAEKLLGDPELPEKYRQAIEEQLQETRYLAETLERLLTLAKAESSVLPLKMERRDPQDFIRQWAEDAQLLAESKGLHLRLEENGAGQVRFDAGWIRQVLFNLLSNALRHSPAGGSIYLSSRAEGQDWIFALRDEGQGVPADRLEDIFERFVQLTPRAEANTGAGLGLAICRSIVERHGGTITASNASERPGLLVVIRLPLEKSV